MGLMRHFSKCPLFAIIVRVDQIRDFSMKIKYKVLFLALIVPKVICKGDFEACLLALNGDHCNSDSFLGSFY